jgi:putative two-component system response regulator
MSSNILVVDDEPFNRELILFAFEDIGDINVLEAEDGAEALKVLAKEDVEVVLLDINMPNVNGFEVLEKMKEDFRLSQIPVVVITANSEEKNRALNHGANDFISKPFDVDELKLRVQNALELRAYHNLLKNVNSMLEDKVKGRTKDLEKALKDAKKAEYEISLRLGKASEFRDLETGMHIKRMSMYSQKLAMLAGLDEDECMTVLYSSALHDIGKVGIPDKILLKPGKLSDDEFEIMKLHANIGEKMLSESDEYPVISAGRVIAHQHHEKYDGTGYPLGLKGDEIHIYARIVTITGVFDALSSKRVYKDAFTLEKTIAILKDGSGKHFDPSLLKLFLDNIDEFLKIQKEFPDKDEAPSILELVDKANEI